MRILVTGCMGFAGGYLIEALLAQSGADLFGVGRRLQWPAELQHLSGRVTLRPCDLADRDALEGVLREVQPERIMHLAGYPHVGRSFQEADVAWAANLTATRNLYEAVQRWGGRPRILYVGSGLVYGEGRSADDLVDEECPLRPVSPYAASKAAGDLASYQLTRSPGLEIVLARPFNHIGPRQSPEFAVPHFAQQIAAIEQGLHPPLVETGDLSRSRDLTDVRDMVRAYQLLMEQGQSGEAYNIGTGDAYSMQTVLDRLLALARTRVEVRPQEKWMRATDTPAIRADASKLRRETSWAPRFSLDQTLADILDYWRSRVIRH